MRTLAEWLTLQESVHPKSIDMGLTRVAAVARALGVDQPGCPVITVGGTNGKGSTVTHLEAVLRASGARTGMFTSPHFIRYNERIQVDGVEATDAELVAAFERIDAARGATTLTFFEFNLLAALVIFAARRVEVLILEVGLGGRLDAVNLVDADVGVVCSIGFDHRDYLGDTLDLIGAEKAGIFRAGHPAVLGTDDMPDSVYSAITALRARAVVAGKDFSWQVRDDGRWSYSGLTRSLRDLPPSALEGEIQYRNAATALAALEALGTVALTEPLVSEALRTVRLPGRFQVVRSGGLEWVLDISHNGPAAVIFARNVQRWIAGRPGKTFAVVGILNDKDAGAIAAATQSVVEHWVLCALSGPRGTSAQELQQRMGLTGPAVTLVASVEAGCEWVRATAKPGDRVLVFGSFHTVGPAMQWLGLY